MGQIAENQIKDQTSTAEASAPAVFCQVRVSPTSYLSAIILFTFLGGFLFYLELENVGIVIIALTWLTLPAFAFFDRIVFDGETLRRTGLIPRLWNSISSESDSLKLDDVEQVETHTLRAARHGSSVFYRYRTQVRGNGFSFVFASGGEAYRSLAQRLFYWLDEDKLDLRSIELRDYLIENRALNEKVANLRLPSEDSLESFRSKSNRETNLRRKKFTPGDTEMKNAESLRRVANELRLKGSLLQSLEAFRRALLLTPNNAWLLYEFARCLHSYSSAERNDKLLRRAHAALRLAENRANRDSELLSRIGESYFQFGDMNKARKAFFRALEIGGENFRAARGLAEVALREGKLGHVVHHFSTAIRNAKDSALKNWAQEEANYFLLLNNDEDYMEAEMTRINWLEGTRTGKSMMVRLAIGGVLTIAIGSFLDETIATLGWSATTISLGLWFGLNTFNKILSVRCPKEITEIDDDDDEI